MTRIKDGIKGARDIKRPRTAELCRCPAQLTDGDDECVWCGHLIKIPPQDALDLVAASPIRSSLQTSHPLPMVLHGVSLKIAA